MEFPRSALRLLTKDWAIGIVLTILVLIGYVFALPPFPSLERWGYDRLSTMRKARPASNVVVVVYDEQDVRRLGPPPALPSDTARLLDILKEQGARAAGLEFLYPVKREVSGMPEEVTAFARELKGSKNKAVRNVGGSLLDMVTKHEKKFDELVQSVKKSGNVVLPARMSGAPEGVLLVPKYLVAHTMDLPLRSPDIRKSLAELHNPFAHLGTELPAIKSLILPYDRLAQASRSLGHTGLFPDADGVLRRERLAAALEDGRELPSFALQVALAHRGKNAGAVTSLYEEEGAHGIAFDSLRVRTDSGYSLLLGRVSDIRRYSFSDVLDSKFDKGMFRDRTVLVGYATNESPAYLMPWGELLPPVLVRATAVENMLSGTYIMRPGWFFALEIAAILYFGVLIALILPRVKARVGLMIAVISVAPWAAAAAFLFMGQGMWLQPFAPVTLLALGYLGLLGRRALVLREAAEAESIESLKMLGLTFQGQGMLDMAFDKFMRCPVHDKSVRELLYNLALDFERKRMPGKAIAVYDHILKAGRFKDVAARADRLRVAESVSTFVAPGAGGTVVLTEGAEKPTFGRYEIITELGRGAMGTVYLGRDPKINRDVAIKTLSYDEVDPGELSDVKERFFREAAAVGKLSHPNIMTIYDAGEDHDMAYMAIELLSGKDLSAYCRTDDLLPPREVLRIVMDVAKALDYAHNNGVVHRDIKPANIMLLDDRTVKVTDFGVARIVESSKTSTGIVLGTPGYMSPEQVSGQKVSGQSDLFSLGVVMYELLTATKPFQGDNIAAIMYNISKCTYTPVDEVDPGVPECMAAIVKKLMAKALSRRYKNGEAVVYDAEECLKTLGGEGR